MSQTSRRWMLTINNPSDADIEAIRSCHKVKLFVGQKECGKSGTTHFQLYIETRGPERFSGIKKFAPKAHIEIAKKPRTACIAYCTKMDTRVSEPITVEKSAFDRTLCRVCKKEQVHYAQRGSWFPRCAGCITLQSKELGDWINKTNEIGGCL